MWGPLSCSSFTLSCSCSDNCWTAAVILLQDPCRSLRPCLFWCLLSLAEAAYIHARSFIVLLLAACCRSAKHACRFALIQPPHAASVPSSMPGMNPLQLLIAAPINIESVSSNASKHPCAMPYVLSKMALLPAQVLRPMLQLSWQDRNPCCSVLP